MKNLAKIRTIQGKTKVDVARHLGISKQRYCLIEANGPKKKDEAFLREIANYLGVSVFDLVGRENLIIQPTDEDEWEQARQSIVGE